jgi:hypothetical protein
LNSSNWRKRNRHQSFPQERGYQEEEEEEEEEENTSGPVIYYVARATCFNNVIDLV